MSEENQESWVNDLDEEMWRRLREAIDEAALAAQQAEENNE